MSIARERAIDAAIHAACAGFVAAALAIEISQGWGAWAIFHCAVIALNAVACVANLRSIE